MPETATLLATAFPAAASHASALLAHTVYADLIQAGLDNTAWIKRLIVETCLQKLN